MAYQLTWRENEILKWNLGMQEQNGVYSYSPSLVQTKDMPSGARGLGLSEGWGLAYQKESGHLFASDGSSQFQTIDPISWSYVQEISASSFHCGYITSFNELEIIQTSDPQLSKYAFSNVFQENDIFMIEIETGKLVAKWDLTELASASRANWYAEDMNYQLNAVLNGIAYYEPNDSFLITGKLWDNIYEVKLNYRDYI